MARYLLLAALLLLAACSEPKPPLRIAITPWPGNEFLYLAEQQQLFEAEGVGVKILQFDSLNDARRAYERGQADGFGGTLVEVLVAREQSQRHPQVVHVTDYSNGGDMLIARPGIDNVRQLVGLRVAVEPGTLNTVILARALEQQGLDLAQVTLTSVPQGQMLEALQQGRVDAVVTYPPFTLEILKQPQFQKIFSTREIPGEILDIVAVDASVLATRKADVQAMLRALEAAHHYTRQHPEQAYAIMAAREGISPEDFRAAVENDLKLLSAADQIAYFGAEQRLLRSLQHIQRVLLHSQELTQPTDLNALVAP
ncbi:nitrate ABC transporter [Pseudomonas sp. HMWF032]|uniref:ABC transporter substrate-binding protein n=1 Tax=Pseudomonas sp. HMWF032 TaxID=2056866 RepID=UPI000D3449DF|nr:ABC transporter substrate-binding protein [Pseudomonas sp. HMWF032]PTS85017.1 nitrate ABC transporter [Pseudomonas sp. HMWF032]PTT81949.1 nitrate ABC transporter [Pseudomonas sp. HMWF010]